MSKQAGIREIYPQDNPQHGKHGEKEETTNLWIQRIKKKCPKGIRGIYSISVDQRLQEKQRCGGAPLSPPGAPRRRTACSQPLLQQGSTITHRSTRATPYEPCWIHEDKVDSRAMLMAYEWFRQCHPQTAVEHGPYPVMEHRIPQACALLERTLQPQEVQPQGTHKQACSNKDCERSEKEEGGYQFRWYSHLWARRYNKYAREGAWRPSLLRTSNPGMNRGAPPVWGDQPAPKGGPQRKPNPQRSHEERKQEHRNKGGMQQKNKKVQEEQQRQSPSAHARPQHQHQYLQTVQQGHPQHKDCNPDFNDIYGNKAEKLPRYPVARPQHAERDKRVHSEPLRKAYTWYIQVEQYQARRPVLPPCGWCGMPTGNFCDICSSTIQRRARPVCTSCEDLEGTCRNCATQDDSAHDKNLGKEADQDVNQDGYVEEEMKEVSNRPQGNLQELVPGGTWWNQHSR